MNIDDDYDNDGNNIVPCPICLDVYCPSKEDRKCPQEDEFAKDYMPTPDTEKFDVIGWLRNTYGLDDDDCLSAGRVQELCESLVYDIQTSRDTYWKERVDAEIADAVDLTKREIKYRVERYFKDAYLALKQQGGVHIHLEEIQEIIDDSTPPGFAPTPLQDK